MNPDAAQDVVDELRDLLEDEGAEIVATYEIWVLVGPARDLERDARFAQRFHHQVHTASGLIDAGSCVREHGELDLDEIGNSFTATRIEQAVARLDGCHLRLLRVPSRQIIAVWDPDQAKLAIALSGALLFDPMSTLSESDFEVRLAEMDASGISDSGAIVSGTRREKISPQGQDGEAARASKPPRSSKADRDRSEYFRQQRFTNLFCGGEGAIAA